MVVDRRAVVGGVAASVVSLASSRTGLAQGEPINILEAREGSLVLVPAEPTAIWGYDGRVPGPVLRIKHGAEVRVRLVNKLAQPTTLCWHGVRIVNAMDGVGGLTQASVAPGASFDYRFTPPDSGLAWFHPHVFPHSAEQIARGLAGVLIVDEPEPPKVDDDLLVVIADWTLDAKGQIAGPYADPSRAAAAGRIGPLVTVNGRPVPIEVAARPGARLRLRLLNVCDARIAIVGFDGMQPTVIAIDGQPSEIFQPARDSVPIGPGSRFEVMIDLPSKTGSGRLVLRGAADVPLMVVAAQGDPVVPHRSVTKLPDNPLLPTRIPLERSLKRDLVIARIAAGVSAKPGAPRWLWSLGGAPSDGISGKPLFTVKHGDAVTLAFVNTTDETQPMHVHGHVFRVLHDLDDGWDPYWRDSLLVGSGKTKHVAFIADNPGRWAIESAILDRQVTGLAGWFEVK